MGYPFVALAHLVGWVERDIGKIYVGFAYLNAPQKFEIATKLANPTRLVADRRLNSTTISRSVPRSEYPLSTF